MKTEIARDIRKHTHTHSPKQQQQQQQQQEDLYHIAQDGCRCEARSFPEYSTPMHGEPRKGIKDTWQAKDKEIQFSS